MLNLHTTFKKVEKEEEEDATGTELSKMLTGSRRRGIALLKIYDDDDYGTGSSSSSVKATKFNCQLQTSSSARHD